MNNTTPVQVLNQETRSSRTIDRETKLRRALERASRNVHRKLEQLQKPENDKKFTFTSLEVLALQQEAAYDYQEVADKFEALGGSYEELGGRYEELVGWFKEVIDCNKEQSKIVNQLANLTKNAIAITEEEHISEQGKERAQSIRSELNLLLEGAS